jgi:hypothetical protein
MRVTIRGTRPVPPTLRGRGTPFRSPQKPQRVMRRELPYWIERGWVCQGNVYHGAYQTPYGSFRGMIEDRGWGDLRFYMFDPPDAVRRSNHWACFAPRGKKGYHVHMGRRPDDASSGILTIERLLAESLELSRR